MVSPFKKGGLEDNRQISLFKQRPITLPINPTPSDSHQASGKVLWLRNVGFGLGFGLGLKEGRFVPNTLAKLARHPACAKNPEDDTGEFGQSLKPPRSASFRVTPQDRSRLLIELADTPPPACIHHMKH